MKSVIFRNEKPVVCEKIVHFKMIGKLEVRRVDGLKQELGVTLHEGLVDLFDDLDAAKVVVVGNVHLIKDIIFFRNNFIQLGTVLRLLVEKLLNDRNLAVSHLRTNI
jgi:hypothetical protein